MNTQNEEFISKYAINKFHAFVYGIWLSLGVTKILKHRRVENIDRLLNGALFDENYPIKILEIGCGSGKDFVQFFKNSKHQLWGVDVFETGIKQDNFIFVKADAKCIPFPDDFFDVVVSIGVLEHIAPIEDLCQSISEIERVSKSFCIVVPAISTIFEPHFWRFFWQLTSVKNTRTRGTNYFSDDAWLSFDGFVRCNSLVKRIFYIPLLISNLFIYKVR